MSKSELIFWFIVLNIGLVVILSNVLDFEVISSVGLFFITSFTFIMIVVFSDIEYQAEEQSKKKEDTQTDPWKKDNKNDLELKEKQTVENSFNSFD